eukprot:222968-Prorocentrum_minimum.AAC.2
MPHQLTFWCWTQSCNQPGRTAHHRPPPNNNMRAIQARRITITGLECMAWLHGKKTSETTIIAELESQSWKPELITVVQEHLEGGGVQRGSKGGGSRGDLSVKSRRP